MKKLFFTAIALVAFSGISMANTIAVEESSNSMEIARDCRQEAIDAYNGVFAATGNHTAASGAQLDALIDCLEVGNPGKPKNSIQ